VGQSFGNVGLIAAIAFKGLRVELTFTISGDSDVFEPTGRGHQVAEVGTVAIPFTFRAEILAALASGEVVAPILKGHPLVWCAFSWKQA
jgi:hypothetical protein